MYEGRTAAEPGITFGKAQILQTYVQSLTELGHENMGIVEELGEGVTLLKKGDRVVMPFNVADGRCRNCEEGKTAFCTGVNPGFAGGAYGRKLCTICSPPWLIVNRLRRDGSLPRRYVYEMSLEPQTI
jgi:threonine dehydrogenase-like Zn-dependent dehydrogenase